MNKKVCKYCERFYDIVTSYKKNKESDRGFDIFIDGNYLCYSYFDNKKQTGSQGVKKIKYCPMCGKKLINT